MKNYFSSSLWVFVVFLLSINQALAQVEIIIKPDANEGKDAYINTLYSTKNGATPSFIASAWTYGGEEGFGRSFIYFRLPELPAIYSNLQITLNLFYDYSSQHEGHGGDNGCKLERITEDWTENGVDWYNQPAVSQEHSIFLPASETSYQDYPDIDVTQLVLDMYENPVHSFGFRMSLIEESIYRSMILASSDHPDESIRPSLVVRYDTCSMPVDFYTYQTDSLHCQFFYSDPSVTTWQWNFGNGYGSVLQNPAYNFIEAGTYFVCLEVENSCGTATICDSVVVCENLVPEYTYEIEDLNVSFYNHTIDALTYFWDFGNGFFSFLENPEFRYNYPGDYYVCLTVSNLCTTSIICDTIRVDFSSGMNSSSWDKNIGIFPIPAHDELFIKSDDNTIRQIELYNSLGILIERIIPESFQNNYRISLQGNTRGIYLIKMFTEKGNISRRLIIM